MIAAKDRVEGESGVVVDRAGEAEGDGRVVVNQHECRVGRIVRAFVRVIGIGEGDVAGERVIEGEGCEVNDHRAIISQSGLHCKDFEGNIVMSDLEKIREDERVEAIEEIVAFVVGGGNERFGGFGHVHVI